MWFITLSVTIYFFSLIFFLIGLKKTKISNSYSDYYPDVSVILCVRDGEFSLPNILDDLLKQSYKGNLEFIIIDDDSNDNTKNIILKFSKQDPRFKYLHSSKDKSMLKHKKKALNIGIKNAKYDWLLFTDVDCRVNKEWVSSMASNYSNNDYVVGYSMTKPGNSFVSKFQSIDYHMLMFSTCASIHLDYPLACSGQNQSYKKQIFNKVGGFYKIADLLQGDDSIFLQICNKIKNLKTSFSTNPNSFVFAKTHHSAKDFLLQRIRWAGDANIMWKYNQIFFIIILSTFLANFFTLYLISSFLLFKNFLLLTVTIISAKFLLEFLIYFFGCKKFNQKIDFFSFIGWFIFQMPYVVLMGIFSFFRSKFIWKNRTA